MDLNAPSISFRINGQPVQGMFESFNLVGLFFPVASFSAGVKYELLSSQQNDIFIIGYSLNYAEMCNELARLIFASLRLDNTVLLDKILHRSWAVDDFDQPRV